MPDSWPANQVPGLAWAHRPWPDFPVLGSRPGACAVLPLCPCASPSPGAPLDTYETETSGLLRQACLALPPDQALLVLPAWRFLPALHASSRFTADFATVHACLLSLAKSVQGSGFRRLVFLAPEEQTAQVASLIAVDARAEFGLDTYVLRTQVDAHASPGSGGRALALAGQLLEIAGHRALPSPPLPRAPEQAPVAPPPQAPPQARPPRLGSLSSEALDRLRPGTVVIPVGAIEQHGHHLPVGVDSILGRVLLDAALALLPSGCPVYATPPLSFGRSNEHAGFPGTLTLPSPALHALLSGLARQLLAAGHRRIRFFNTHGGNTPVLSVLVAELRAAGHDCALLRGDFNPDLAPQEAAWGFHADEWETSLMLACAAPLVDMSRATCEYPARLGDPGTLRPEKAAATFAWLTRDLSVSGVIGDPRTATREKGLRWLAGEAESLSRALRD